MELLFRVERLTGRAGLASAFYAAALLVSPNEGENEVGLASEEQAQAILDALKVRDADREAAMPDWRAALHQTHTAKERLNKLGWRDGIYCPKDGTSFALIEWGSTGVHCGHYLGEWPEGRIYCDDFLIHPHGVMFKAISALTADEKNAMERSVADGKQFMERQLSRQS